VLILEVLEIAGALHHSTGAQSSEGVQTLASAHVLHWPTSTVSEYFMLESRAWGLEESLEEISLLLSIEHSSAFEVWSLASGD